MTDLEKRLIALSSLGIRIEHESGHRWIMSTPTEFFDFAFEVEHARQKGVSHYSKIYGGINEALDEVDKILSVVHHSSLITHFNTLNQEWLNDGYDSDAIANLYSTKDYP